MFIVWVEILGWLQAKAAYLFRLLFVHWKWKRYGVWCGIDIYYNFVIYDFYLVYIIQYGIWKDTSKNK